MKIVSGPHFIYEPEGLRVGESTSWHTHNFPHNTIALSGDVLVELRDRFEFIHQIKLLRDNPTRWVLAPAGVEHRITLLSEDARVVCFFSHFDPDTGKPIEYFADRMEAYI